MPFLAQLLTDKPFDEIKETVVRLTAKMDRPLLVLIDTLDILVGINDHTLATTLNFLIASGCMLITCSRKQEIEKLSIFIQSDKQVELDRYNEHEAKDAIQNYINICYPNWSKEGKKHQFSKVWELLDQQRSVARELNFEPLILRMIFETYVPEDIPQDINTQKVYDRFWEKRVLLDRSKDANERFTRGQLCHFLAKQIAFNERKGHSDTFPIQDLSKSWAQENQDSNFPFDTIEKLISIGILQWAKGKSAIRFFHQTFFEYTTAHYLISLRNNENRKTYISILLQDVMNFNFFRVPIIKQLIIQDFYGTREVWNAVMNQLREINNELSAQLVLEIIGKIQDTNFCIELCKNWIKEDHSKLQGVILKTIKYYPRNRIEVALELLQPYLYTAIENEIYSLCEKSFANIAPSTVYYYLCARLDEIKKSKDDNKKTLYRDALCSVMHYGVLSALNELSELFVCLKPGQQAGMLNSVVKLINGKSAENVAFFLEKIFDTVAQRENSETWPDFLKAFARVYEVTPETIIKIADKLKETKWRISISASILVGRIIGKTLVNENLLLQALKNVASDDHHTRMMNTEILYSANQRFSKFIMNSILTVDMSYYKDEDRISSLFRVVSGLKNIESATIFQFLEKWPWPKTKIGLAMRDIFKDLAYRDSETTKNWLLEKLKTSEEQLKGKIFTAFSILIQTDINIFNTSDLNNLYKVAFSSSNYIKEDFARVTGCIAKVDESLADEIFLRIFQEEGINYQTAAINSLNNCLNTCPEFILNQGDRIINLMSSRNTNLLHCFLEVLKEFPQSEARSLLTRLNNWFTPQLLQNIHDEKTLVELINILIIFAKEDTYLVLNISDSCRLVSKGVAGALSALYENITKYSDDANILMRCLDGFGKVCHFSQKRIGNSLRRGLPLLDQKLHDKKVTDMIFKTYKEIKDERALETLIRAALEVPSWTKDDTKILAQDQQLPSSIRGVLMTERKCK